MGIFIPGATLGLTDEQKQMVKDFMKANPTGENFKVFCSANRILYLPALKFLATETAPTCCKQCVHVTAWPYGSPCNSCCRSKLDYFEPDPDSE